MSLFRRISKQLRFLNSSFPLLVAPLLSAADPAVEDTAELEQRIRFSEAKAMDTEFLPLQTAAILDNFYRRSFGGPENWAKVQSMRFDGILHLPQGKIRFIAFKKKPNLCKVVIFGGGAQRMIMAYDGEDAWQLMNSESDDPVDMPELEAINFIRDAELGGNLMFPKFPGKQIERLNGRIVEGSSCLVFKVTRPDGQEVEYAIDATTYSERQMAVT
ncbi:MAG: hypothetical protein HRT56_07655, partial [Coraliomargarita sp.]|nr:hypothetical protein [Coraliomargarita sp.]